MTRDKFIFPKRATANQLPASEGDADSISCVKIDMTSNEFNRTQMTQTPAYQELEPSIDGKIKDQKIAKHSPFPAIVKKQHQQEAKRVCDNRVLCRFPQDEQKETEDDEEAMWNIVKANKNQKISALTKQVKDSEESKKYPTIRHLRQKDSIHGSSSLNMEDYFKQDKATKKEEQMKHIITDITKFKSYFVTFRFKFFVEFFFYHSLYYVFLGPFANPIILWFGKGLPRNLMFWGHNSEFYSQFIAYILQFIAILLYAYYPTKYVYFQSEILYLFLTLFYRMFTIAAKYATFDPYKILAMKNNVFTPAELERDYFLNEWRSQTDRIIYEEIYFAQRVYDIDPSWFYLEFIVDMEQETAEKLRANNIALGEYHKFTKTPFDPQSIHTNSPTVENFFIYGIIKELVDTFQEKFSEQIKHVKTIAAIFSFVSVSIPIIYKIFEFGSELFENSGWHEYFISATVAYLQYLLYYYTVWILLHGIIDMKRKIYLLEQMAFMICPRKMRNIDADKVLPTINIFKSSNVKAWQLMRHVCQEYGKRFDIRVQAYFSGIVVVIIVSFIVLLLQFAQEIQLEKSFIVVLLFETISLLIVLSGILYFGATINQQFKVHDHILNQNKNVVVDIFRMRRRYFGEQFISTNYLYNKGVKKILEEAQLLNLDNPFQQIKEIVDSYDIHINELRCDEEQNPFKIGSIKVTYGLLESGVLGVASIAAAVISKFFSTKVSTN